MSPELLSALRDELAAVDETLVAAIAARRAIVERIAAAKQKLGLPPFVASAEASRDTRVRASARRHGVDPELVTRTLAPLFDDALAGQCALAALILQERDLRVYVTPALAKRGGTVLLESLDSAGIARVSSPEHAWILHAFDESVPRFGASPGEDEPRETLRGDATQTQGEEEPARGVTAVRITQTLKTNGLDPSEGGRTHGLLRAQVTLSVSAGDPQEPRAIFAALGADVSYFAANTM